jgi:hypothetical protein
VRITGKRANPTFNKVLRMFKQSTQEKEFG